MTIYHNDRQSTQEIKKFLKPHTTNKLYGPQEKPQKVVKETPRKTLPIRGN